MSDGVIYASDGTNELTELADAPDEADRFYVGDMSESTDADKNKFLKARYIMKLIAERTMTSMEYGTPIVSMSSGDVMMRLASTARS